MFSVLSQGGPGKRAGGNTPRGSAQLFPQLADLPQLPATSKGSGEPGGGAPAIWLEGARRHILPGLRPRPAPPPPLHPLGHVPIGHFWPCPWGSEQLHVSRSIFPLVQGRFSSITPQRTPAAVWGGLQGAVSLSLQGPNPSSVAGLPARALSAGMGTTHAFRDTWRRRQQTLFRLEFRRRARWGQTR